MRLKAVILVGLLSVVSVSAVQQQPPPPVPNCPEVAAAIGNVMRNDVRSRDWGNLARYRDANRTLAAPAASEARVVFMGDSITDSWPQPRFGDFFAGKPYVGRGISGQTTPQMLLRFRPDVIDLKPKVVVILAGTNDIAGNTGLISNEDIQGNLASMSELAKAHGIRVVLSSILPVSAYHTSPTGTPADHGAPDGTDPRSQRLDEEVTPPPSGHVYLDYFSAMIGRQRTAA